MIEKKGIEQYFITFVSTYFALFYLKREIENVNFSLGLGLLGVKGLDFI